MQAFLSARIKGSFKAIEYPWGLRVDAKGHTFAFDPRAKEVTKFKKLTIYPWTPRTHHDVDLIRKVADEVNKYP